MLSLQLVLSLIERYSEMIPVKGNIKRLGICFEQRILTL
jgi:hypothetical protein